MSLEPIGDCYPVSVQVMEYFHEFGVKGHRLVHGLVVGQGEIEGHAYGHSWVEYEDTVFDYSNGQRIIASRSFYYGVGRIRIEECHSYSLKEMYEQMIKTNHFGPWHDGWEEESRW